MVGKPQIWRHSFLSIPYSTPTDSRSTRKRLSAFILSIFVLSLSACADQQHKNGYSVIEKAIHDPLTFTQGLELKNQWMYESSGLYGKSYLSRYSLTQPSNAATRDLPARYFAEGLTLFNDRLYLVTWQEQKALVFQAESLKQLKSFNYEGEGWGLTHNDTHLIMSNGSNNITFRSPKTFEIERSIQVHSPNKTWNRINELEYVNGIIWANQWQEDLILAIDAQSGLVMATIDISELQNEAATNSQSLANGIAYDSDREAFWLTGKYWKYRYLVTFDEPSTSNQ